MSKRPKKRKHANNQDLRGYIGIHHVAQAAGVTTDAVAVWIRNNMGAQTLKLNDKKHRIVSVRAAEEYLSATRAPKAAHRPKGWVTIKSILTEAGITHTPMTDWLVTHNMRCITHKNIIYVHPEDAKYAVLNFKNRRPLPGFISLNNLSEELNRNKVFIHRARHKLGITTRLFREPGKREQGYLSAHDADLIRAESNSAPRRKPTGGKTHELTNIQSA